MPALEQELTGPRILAVASEVFNPLLLRVLERTRLVKEPEERVSARA
jgi:hypothetical protein